MKFTFAIFAVLPFAMVTALHADDSPPSAAKPNIVFIYADDWGWGDLSCHGSDYLDTPNIDRMASEGTDFLQFNVLNPVCSPSRVAAMTGRYPSRYGFNSVAGARNPGPEQPDWLDPKAPTAARYLQAAGYRTAHFGKWHMGEKPDNPPMSAYGFDESAVFHGPGPGIKHEDIATRAAQFIRENKDGPFFVNVWIHESHTSHSPTAASMEKWKDLDDEQKRIYAAVITDGDNKVGEVLDALDEAGIAENTIVVFSSDNGPERTSTAKGRPGKYGSYYSVGETGGLRGRKRNLFEGGIRTPLIVRWPARMATGIRNDTTVCTAVDLLPTFCAAAGVTPPEDALGDGESLLAAFEGKSITRTRPIFWLHTGAGGEPDGWPRLAVREGDWKLVTTLDGKRVELHDMKSDREEDIAKDQSETHPEIVEKLKKMVLDWHATLPTTPDPSCLSTAKEGETTRTRQPKKTPDEAGGKAKSDRGRHFARWDKNGDGFLTSGEYRGGEASEGRFNKFDKDGDGKLSLEEYSGSPAK